MKHVIIGLAGLAALAPMSALADRHRDFGRVLDVEPIVHYSAREISRHSCVRYVDDGRRHYNSFTPTVLGAVVGSAVGYKLADHHGDPQVVAIAAGLLGASIGRDLGYRARESRRIAVDGPCVPRAQHRQVRRESVEYIVTYRYNGQVYRTRMDRDPGDWVALNVDVKPA